MQWAMWMRAASGGDAAAYRRFLEDVAPYLRAIARRRFFRSGRPEGEAEDVVQEILLALHLKRHTWDPDRPIGPWLAAITRNKLVDALRRGGHARAQVPIEEVMDSLAAQDRTDHGPAQELDRLLGRLADRQRAVVRAVSLEGASAREAAAQLKMTEGAVRVTLHRALRTLAALYGRDAA
nr:sigma-70 family RNA polymerase sigma factor [Pseudoroseomonas coralli]